MTLLNGRILLVDDDQAVLYTARLILKQVFSQVDTESSPAEILTRLKRTSYDVILLDMNFAPGKTSGEEGLGWIRKIRQVDSQVKIMVTTAYGDIALAVSAMKEGAVDFLEKPWEKEKLVTVVTSVYHLNRSPPQVEQLKQQPGLHQEPESPYAEIVSQSAAMQAVYETLEKVAVTDASVLVLGENGTGKELIARALHRRSHRAAEAFVKVDLGAITDTLFESELFGHARGAFTGAVDHRMGRFEVASGGTLFLDEIGNLPLTLQAKLLTALQSKQIIRVGTNQPIDTNVRLISATNQPVHALVEEHPPRFRPDLLYRINTVEILLPPLRERREDIPLLVNHFLAVYGTKYHKEGRIHDAALRQLQRYDWPGNVRELQHAVERAVILSDSGTVAAGDLLAHPGQRPAGQTPATYHMESVERTTIAHAVSKHQGNLSQAAQELGMGRSTLYRKMKKYGL